MSLLENKVVMKICGPKRGEATGESSKLHKEEPQNLLPSNSIMVIKLTRMRWAGHALGYEKYTQICTLKTGRE
jgi:hypothetical protein